MSTNEDLDYCQYRTAIRIFCMMSMLERIKRRVHSHELLYAIYHAARIKTEDKNYAWDIYRYSDGKYLKATAIIQKYGAIAHARNGDG